MRRFYLALLFTAGAILISIALALSLPTSRSLQNQVVDSASCSSCHPDSANSFAQTTMGRSAGAIEEVAGPENWDSTEPFYHSKSDRYFRPFRQKEAYYLERYQLDGSGRLINRLIRQIHFAIGSATHARTFVHQMEDGRLLELPLSWYSENGGYWAMSPGYDRPDHLGFRRQVTDKCIFCHAAYPASPEKPVPHSIDCQRCHGPGALHIENVTSGSSQEKIRRSIVNPSRLSAKRLLEVCLQCHLETTSRPLPDSIRRPARPVFSFVPGEQLGHYKLYFDHPPKAPQRDRFEVNSAGYTFLQSACFQNSPEMTCLTCHSPHQPLRGEKASDHYRDVCLSCHSSTVASLVQQEQHPESGDCLGCHMPRMRTDDAVHVVMTDHRIPTRPSRAHPLAPVDELEAGRKARYQGPVVLFYPSNLPSPSDELYLALAQVRDGADLSSGLSKLEAAVNTWKPEQAEFYFQLAKAHRNLGNPKRAIHYFKETLNRDPGHREVYSDWADTVLRQGDPQQVRDIIRKALEETEPDSRLLTLLGIALGQEGHLNQSVQRLREAVQLTPHDATAWLNLGTSLEQDGQLASAQQAYREAIRMQPDFAFAHLYLANLLRASGQSTEAEEHYQKAIALDPELKQRTP